MVTDHDIYFFDLQGYLVIKNAITPQEVRDCNECLDGIPQLAPGEWYGGVHCHTYGTKDGLNYQQIYEAGEPFEKLIDHPSWIDKMKHFMGGTQSFDMKHGPLFIDECFANFRGPGEAIGMHSGGNTLTKRNQYRVYNGQFMCCQINILVALTDIGPGDSATMLIPGSHKQHHPHPDLDKFRMKPEGSSGDGLEGAQPMYLNKGDALLFSDATCHGSAKRINPGIRRTVVYRYGPSWGFFRHGYRPTQELLDRLTPERRQIVWPHTPFQRTPNKKPGFTEIDVNDGSAVGTGKGG